MSMYNHANRHLAYQSYMSLVVGPSEGHRKIEFNMTSLPPLGDLPKNETSFEFAEPVAIPKFDRPTLELTYAYVACIEPKLGAALIRPISTLLICPTFNHLKRVRKQTTLTDVKLEIILWPAENNEQQQEEQVPNSTTSATADSMAAQAFSVLPQAAADILRQHPVEIKKILVPKYMPWTIDESKEWGKHWPLTYRRGHPSLELQQGDVAVMKNHMSRAVELASLNAKSGGEFNSCIIVDPSNDARVAEVADCRHNHPLHHAAMQAAAAVGEWQLRIWPATPTEIAVSNFHTSLAAALKKRKKMQQQLENGSSSKNEEEEKEDKAGLDVDCEENAPANQQQEVVNADEDQQQQPSNVSSASSGDLATMTTHCQQAPTPSSVLPDRPYLCTGYDAYLASEPCHMCAMALVHSRVRRVVYCKSDYKHGALGGSGMRLHSQTGMNHYYHVFKLPLME